MLRYLSPILFFTVALYVYWHNHNDGTSIWKLPFMDVIWPETASSQAAQGDKTVIVLIILGFVFMLLQAFKDRRYRQKLQSHFQEPKS